MKRSPAFPLAALILGLVSVSVFLTRSYASDDPKELIPGTNPFTSRMGGETIATATPISAVPFSDMGSTCGAANDYDETCPYFGGSAPDVVYSFTPPANQVLNLRLCHSYYDTKLYVYEDAYTPGAPYACNDDACSGPNFPMPYLSELPSLFFGVGHTYYIVVDGYLGECGTYVLDFTTCASVSCPGDAELENEPDCGTDYVDSYNGGCVSNPPVFQPLCPEPGSLSAVLCGRSGTYAFGTEERRDSDWYLCYGTGAVMTATVESVFPVLLFFFYGTDCYEPLFDSAEGGACESVSLSRYVGSESYVWIYVAPSILSGVACGSEYVLTMDGIGTGPDCEGTAARETSWGGIKNLYR